MPGSGLFGDGKPGEQAIRRIAELYAREKQARGKFPKERVALRREHAMKPIEIGPKLDVRRL